MWFYSGYPSDILADFSYFPGPWAEGSRIPPAYPGGRNLNPLTTRHDLPKIAWDALVNFPDTIPTGVSTEIPVSIQQRKTGAQWS